MNKDLKFWKVFFIFIAIFALLCASFLIWAGIAMWA